MISHDFKCNVTISKMCIYWYIILKIILCFRWFCGFETKLSENMILVYILHIVGNYSNSRPPIYSMLTVLLETQFENEVKINTIYSNEKKNMTLQKLERIENTIKAYDKYKSCKSKKKKIM